jgi:hypothetical protein
MPPSRRLHTFWASGGRAAAGARGLAGAWRLRCLPVSPRRGSRGWEAPSARGDPPRVAASTAAECPKSARRRSAERDPDGALCARRTHVRISRIYPASARTGDSARMTPRCVSVVHRSWRPSVARERVGIDSRPSAVLRVETRALGRPGRPPDRPGARGALESVATVGTEPSGRGIGEAISSAAEPTSGTLDQHRR